MYSAPDDRPPIHRNHRIVWDPKEDQERLPSFILHKNMTIMVVETRFYQPSSFFRYLFLTLCCWGASKVATISST